MEFIEIEFSDAIRVHRKPAKTSLLPLLKKILRIIQNGMIKSRAKSRDLILNVCVGLQVVLTL
jgi:hypothetical protein